MSQLIRHPLRFVFLLACTMMGSVPLYGSPLNIAVNDLLPRGVDTTDASIISDRLRSELLSTGRFRVMERGQMDQILKEQAFQQSGVCDQSECAVEIGKLLSVDRIIVGTVGRLGEVYTIQARVLDVGTGEIVFSTNQDYDGRIDGLLSVALPKLATRLASITRTDSVGGKADLLVSTSEPGAEVYLDGVKVGASPLNLPGTPAGDHRVEVRKGDLYGMKQVELRADDIVRVEIAMEIGMGSVKVYTDPAGAAVMLDSIKHLGETPLKAERIPMGVHHLQVALPGHIPRMCSLIVRPNETQTLSLQLEPGALASISSPAVSKGLFVRGSKDSIVGDLPGSLWLGSGQWTISVDAGSDWKPWVGTLKVGTDPISTHVDLMHTDTWNDSASAARHRTIVLSLRWLSGFGAIAMACTATYFHVQAAQAKDDADKASSAYDATPVGGDFGSSKARYKSAVDENESFSRRAVMADIGTGVLASGFLLTWAF